ncbi:methyltransferase domain-containing protein [Candidatus Pacearchaeota archaeon]|nr:methyltransferase domain-containing protein [Candidatus Pacearchaeota archaeon]
MTKNKARHKICPASKAGGLDNFFRKIIHNPKKIFGSYVKPGMTVLDIGCGSGLYSREMSLMVGKKGKVIAVDLQKEMLNKLKLRIMGSEIEKIIKPVKCKKGNIGVKEKVDFVLAFYMVHEVVDKEKFFNQIKKIMKKNSKFLVVEPKNHVSEEEFNKTIKLALKKRFRILKKPKVFFSRAVLLGV